MSWLIDSRSRKLASLGAPWGEALAGVVVYANEVSRGAALPKSLLFAILSGD